jgi:hypothetical protein
MKPTESTVLIVFAVLMVPLGLFSQSPGPATTVAPAEGHKCAN